MEPIPQLTCNTCHFQLLDTYYFCPNCGKKIKATPITIGEQIGLYALSVLLPPLGLIPSIKNLFQKEQKRKVAGIIGIVLTIISIVITIWFSMKLITQLNNTLNSQLGGYDSIKDLQ